MGSKPGSPFGLEDRACSTSWMFNFGRLKDSLDPYKQETRGLDTIQATSFFPWYFSSVKNILTQWEICTSKS